MTHRTMKKAGLTACAFVALVLIAPIAAVALPFAGAWRIWNALTDEE